MSRSPRRLVLDLSGLTFIDSSALGAIIAVHEQSRQQGIEVIVIRGTGQVARVFELTGADRRLATVDTAPDLGPA